MYIEESDGSTKASYFCMFDFELRFEINICTVPTYTYKVFW